MSKSAFRIPAVRWTAIAVFISAAALLLFYPYHYTAARAARKEAMEFVQLPGGGGHVSWGYGYFPFSSSTRTTASIAQDRMNNHMAEQLVKIYDLTGVIVYQPVPNVGRLDVPTNHWTVPASLRKLDLPMSDQSIAAIERRFPNLKVYVLKPVGVKN